LIFHSKQLFVIANIIITNFHWGHPGRDRMVVGFTTTCAISAYHC